MHCVRACAMCVRLHACVHQRRTLSCAVSTRERLLVDRNDELEDRLRDYENMQACAYQPCKCSAEYTQGATRDTHELRDCSRV